MRVKNLELKNFQVISDFSADFEGNVYLVTGDNELGKSTVLKAIGALLTGERDAVLKLGESKGFAKMVVGDNGEEYEVELRFTKANPRGRLTIKQKTTGMQSENVSMLQKIFGYTDFDAVEFSRWSDTAEGRRKQIEVVKSLLPEDVRNRIAEIDSSVIGLKTKRTDVNRELKTYLSISQEAGKELEGKFPDEYTQLKDVTQLMEEQKVNAQLIEKAKTMRSALELRTNQIKEIPERLQQLNSDRKKDSEKIDLALYEAKKAYDLAVERHKNEAEEIESNYNKNIEVIKQEEKDFTERKSNIISWLKQYEENNPEELDTAEQLRKLEEHNRLCVKFADVAAKRAKADNKAKESVKLDKEITDLQEEREKLIKVSSLPIDGLTFTDEGLELNGVPFVSGKVSDSQIMEVAAKLIIASNPKVKVFRIARGESLGQKRMQDIIDIAKANGFQGFIEEVKRGQDNLVIEEYSEN